MTRLDQIVKITSTTKTGADGLAACFGLTRPRIVQLAKEGVLVRDDNSKYCIADSIQRYVNSKAGNNGESYDVERTKHEKFKSRLTELKLAKIENRMHDAHDVELVMMEMLTNIRTQLLGLPSALAGKLADLPQEKIYGILTAAIEDKLIELSEYKPDMFNEAKDYEEDD